MMNAGVYTSEEGAEEKDKDYVPMMDYMGPMMFFPPHCVPLPDDMIWGSPIIGTLKSDSKI
jgi:hypothetical protein